MADTASTRKRYRGEAVDVSFDPMRCRHAAECVRGLGAVFDTDRRHLGADTNLQAAFEIENMMWTEVIQSDDAQLALKTCVAVDPDSRRDWFESENSNSYPTCIGH